MDSQSFVSPEFVRGQTQGFDLYLLSGQSNMAYMDINDSFVPSIMHARQGAPFAVVKTAQAKMPIQRWLADWTELTGEQGHRRNGIIYRQLLRHVRHVIGKSQPGRVSLAWMQGEADASRFLSHYYEIGMRHLITKLESDLAVENLRGVIGRLASRELESPLRESWHNMRDIQVRFAENRPGWTWIDTDELSVELLTPHFTSEGYDELGRRFARACLEVA